MRTYKKWTKEEDEYLAENWGVMSLPQLSKKLERTIPGIKRRRSRLNLGPFLKGSDYITLRELFDTLGYTGYCDSSSPNSIKAWMKRDFPILTKTIESKKVKCVHIKNFWKWAEDNQVFLDFSKFDRLMLGKEPDWVEPKRNRDRMNQVEISKYNREWTQKDEEYLFFLVNEYKYSCYEIAQRLCRTEDGILQKVKRMNTKARPIKKEMEFWTDNEICILNNLILKGYDYMSIARVIKKKSPKSVKSRVYRTYGTKDLDKVRRILKEKISKATI